MEVDRIVDEVGAVVAAVMTVTLVAALGADEAGTGASIWPSDFSLTIRAKVVDEVTAPLRLGHAPGTVESAILQLLVEMLMKT